MQGNRATTENQWNSIKKKLEKMKYERPMKFRKSL